MGQVEDIMNAWKKQVDSEMKAKCVTLARQVLQRALYYREQLVAYNIGHNFTGNFVNSIVCGVWENGANISMLLGSKFVGHAPPFCAPIFISKRIPFYLFCNDAGCL